MLLSWQQWFQPKQQQSHTYNWLRHRAWVTYFWCINMCILRLTYYNCVYLVWPFCIMRFETYRIAITPLYLHPMNPDQYPCMTLIFLAKNSNLIMYLRILDCHLCNINWYTASAQSFVDTHLSTHIGLKAKWNHFKAIVLPGPRHMACIYLL